MAKKWARFSRTSLRSGRPHAGPMDQGGGVGGYVQVIGILIPVKVRRRGCLRSIRPKPSAVIPSAENQLLKTKYPKRYTNIRTDTTTASAKLTVAPDRGPSRNS